MKITTTFAMKVPGPEEYSSLGYHLTIEATPDETITKDRERLAEYTRRLFAECRERVEDEISQAGREPRQRRPQNGNGHSRRNGRSPSNGSHNGSHRAGNGATASPKQVNYLRSLANESGLGYGGLDDLAQSEFGKAVRDLSKREASQLIEELRA